MNMRIVCARLGNAGQYEMEHDACPRNRLGRFFYFQHLNGFQLTAIGADERPQFGDQRGLWRHPLKCHRLPAILTGRHTNLPVQF